MRLVHAKWGTHMRPVDAKMRGASVFSCLLCG